jgi:transposase
MTGKSPLWATEEQRAELTILAGSRDRGEADRARAVLLTLAGWTSPRIAEAFGVREDTVRLWRSDFMNGGVAALKASVAPAPAPVKSEAALRVITPLLEEPVADRRNWTIPRLRAEVEAREGVRQHDPFGYFCRRVGPSGHYAKLDPPFGGDRKF